jgi:hypothetical protein
VPLPHADDYLLLDRGNRRALEAQGVGTRVDHDLPAIEPRLEHYTIDRDPNVCHVGTIRVDRAGHDGGHHSVEIGYPTTAIVPNDRRALRAGTAEEFLTRRSQLAVMP